MVRSLFSYEMIGDFAALIRLDNLLEDSFTIIKELFILEIIETNL